MRTLGLILISLLAPAAPGAFQATADLSIEHGVFVDPTPTGFYSYYVRNLGPEPAVGVRLFAELGDQTPFRSLSVDGPVTDPRCTTPPEFRSGAIEITLGTLDPGSLVSIRLVTDTEGEPGTGLPVTMRVVSTTPDENQSNNEYEFENFIEFPPVAPVVTRIREGRGAGFTIEIDGDNLDPGFGRVVGIGCDCAGWNRLNVLGNTRLEIVGGPELRRLFPKGERVQICIVNASGGELRVFFTRR